MAFQGITSDRDIENLTQLGRDINAFTSTDDNYIFPGGHGFMDGGCYAFALALKEWHGEGELAVMVNKASPQHIQHFILKVKYDGQEAYLDGDGLALGDEIINKLTVLESCQPTFILTLDDYEKRFGEYNQDDSMIFSYAEIGVPNELTKRLKRQINYENDSLSMR